MKKVFLVSTWARGFGFALMLALCESAWSQGIVYVQPQQPIYYSGIVANNYNVNIDINGDGTTDFVLSSQPNETVSLIPEGNNSIVAIPEPPPDLGYFVAALNPGTSIGSSLDPVLGAQWYNNQTDQFGSAWIGTMAGFDHNVVISGYFTGLPSAYIGFDLVENGTNYYGWMQVSNPLQFLYGNIVDWAYETTPNTPIMAGEVPEPSTYALLLVAGLAFSVWNVCKRKAPRPTDKVI